MTLKEFNLYMDKQFDLVIKQLCPEQQILEQVQPKKPKKRK